MRIVPSMPLQRLSKCAMNRLTTFRPCHILAEQPFSNNLLCTKLGTCLASAIRNRRCPQECPCAPGQLAFGQVPHKRSTPPVWHAIFSRRLARLWEILIAPCLSLHFRNHSTSIQVLCLRDALSIRHAQITQTCSPPWHLAFPQSKLGSASILHTPPAPLFPILSQHRLNRKPCHNKPHWPLGAPQELREGQGEDVNQSHQQRQGANHRARGHAHPLKEDPRARHGPAHFTPYISKTT